MVFQPARGWADPETAGFGEPAEALAGAAAGVAATSDRSFPADVHPATAATNTATEAADETSRARREPVMAVMVL
ncbi:hypothetical protein Aph02nite_06380 [Actinoplanes philippinensis]|nr:hypothetical protein Aph02nite_06380 [Actinoplanes philippinensis]